MQIFVSLLHAAKHICHKQETQLPCTHVRSRVQADTNLSFLCFHKLAYTCIHQTPNTKHQTPNTCMMLASIRLPLLTYACIHQYISLHTLLTYACIRLHKSAYIRLHSFAFACINLPMRAYACLCWPYACVCVHTLAYACIRFPKLAYACLCLHTLAYACIRLPMLAIRLRMRAYACLCLHTLS